MNPDTVTTTYKRYSQLMAEGKGDEAQKVLKEAVERMTPDERNSLIAELAAMALEDEAAEKEALVADQEMTIDAYEQLEELANELKKEAQKDLDK